MNTKLIADEIAMPTTAGTASSITEATCVRLFNGHSAVTTISLSTSVGAASTISFSLQVGAVEFLQKRSTEVIFASNAAVKAAKVGLTN